MMEPLFVHCTDFNKKFKQVSVSYEIMNFFV